LVRKSSMLQELLGNDFIEGIVACSQVEDAYLCIVISDEDRTLGPPSRKANSGCPGIRPQCLTWV
jgi:hypothetical protein